LPAILLVVGRRSAFFSQSRARRLSYLIGVVLVVWQWGASFSLTVIFLTVSPAWALHAWKFPLFTMLAIPVWVLVVAFFHAKEATD
jgi:cellulose synthase/poly-beta-1,6-N-acetylglucosamine synthase-like glycosyltransferase